MKKNKIILIGIIMLLLVMLSGCVERYSHEKNVVYPKSPDIRVTCKIWRGGMTE